MNSSAPKKIDDAFYDFLVAVDEARKDEEWVLKSAAYLLVTVLPLFCL